MTNRSVALLGAASLAILGGGCEKQSPATDAGAVKSAIQSDEKKWNDQFKGKDTEALVSHYADDAFFVGPGVKGTDGSMAIRKAYADASTDPNFSVTFGSDKIDVAGSGDLAYARGHFSETYTDPQTKKAMKTSGSYITVYKKQSDGSWKAVEDFAASDPDATKPAEPAKPAA